VLFFNQNILPTSTILLQQLMQRKSTINNYSKSYLNKNRSETNALLTFHFDSYLDRLIF